MNSFTLEILAAEKPFFKGECISLVVPTTQGQYGIQAMHSNMITAIIPGMLKITTPDEEVSIAAVSEGLVKVENNHVLVLVDTAEHPDEIDANRARHSAEMAKEAILQKKSIQDYHLAQAKMSRALSRLKVKEYGNTN